MIQYNILIYYTRSFDINQMDTILQIPSNFIKDFDLIQPASLNADESKTVMQHIGLTRDVKESKQLFDIFYFNLLCLRNNFTLYAGDTVERLSSCPDYASENISVNALVINLISSAKTLVEFLRTSAREWFEKDSNGKDKFGIYVSEIYDKSSNYRILMNLRDFAQHGSLPVSCKEGRYSFDIYQILTAPYFSLNKQVKTDMEDFLSKFDLSKNVPCLALTFTIADFVVMVTEVYRTFLSFIKKCISSSYSQVRDMIKSNPSLLCNNHTLFEGNIIFVLDNMYHAFDTRDDSNLMVIEHEKTIADIYKTEKNSFEALKSSFHFE